MSNFGPETRVTQSTASRAVVEAFPSTDLPDDNDAFLEAITRSAKMLPHTTTIVETHGSYDLDNLHFPEPVVPGLRSEHEQSQADQGALSNMEQLVRASLLTHPDEHLYTPKKRSIWEKAKRYIRTRSIARKIGQAAAVSLVVATSLLLPPEGKTTPTTEQKPPSTSIPQLDSTPQSTLATTVNEAQPAKAIKQAPETVSSTNKAAPQVLTLRVTQKDNNLWEAADQALSTLPRYQNEQVPDKDIAAAIHAAVWINRINPNLVNIGDEVVTVAPNQA